MESKLTNEDKVWISSAKTEDEQRWRKDALINIIETNGIKCEPGLGKSYIPERAYVQMVVDDSLSTHILMLYNQALNWDALGRGVGGLAGAAVRLGLWDKFVPDREVNVIRRVDEAHIPVLKDYVSYLSTRRDTYAFWNAQCLNILGLAGAIFNREMHHWDSDNTRPQKALLGALDQIDVIPDSEYRKLFYLSIHPIPLKTMEQLRQDIVNNKVQGINDTVITRCRSAPAGYGDVHACAQAIPELKIEKFYEDFGERLKSDINGLEELNSNIIKKSGEYSPFAATYGYTRVVINKNIFKRSMACLCAYIMVYIKGSLAQSASLRKFRNTHARTIQKWVSAFEETVGPEASTIAGLASDGT